MSIEWIWHDGFVVLRDRVSRIRYGVVMWIGDCTHPWLACPDREAGRGINKSFTSMGEAEQYLIG